MGPISSRIYRKEEDLQSMLQLMIHTRPEKFKRDYPTPTDLEEHLASQRIRSTTRLWWDADRLAAWVYVDDFNNLLWEIEPQYVPEIGAALVDWGVAILRSRSAAEKPDSLDAGCREDDPQRVRFLEQHGFRRTRNVTLHMQRDLSQPIPEAVLPEGFSIRSVSGKEQAAAIAALHRAAFGTDFMTTENRLAIMNTSTYDPGLDLLVMAPAHQKPSLAAYCTCSVNEQDKIGTTDPVATHPVYQKRGLARALILTGLGKLKQRGMHTAGLGTSAENLALRRTAESVGYYIDHTIIWLEKRMSSA